jgi:hypothetical protein
MQRAYDAFRAKLAEYNRRYAPAHVPELLLNTPSRLAIWCRRMQDLYLRVPQGPPPRCPAHLLEKAYRRADSVAGKAGADSIRRAGPPDNLADVVRALEALAQWCEDLAAAPGGAMAATDAPPPSGLCA